MSNYHRACYRKGYKPSIEEQRQDKVKVDAFIDSLIKERREALLNEQTPQSPKGTDATQLNSGDKPNGA